MSKSAIHSALSRAREFLRSEDGPSATEYAIMLALIVLVSVGAIGMIGTKVQYVYDNIEAAVAATGM